MEEDFEMSKRVRIAEERQGVKRPAEKQAVDTEEAVGGGSSGAPASAAKSTAAGAAAGQAQPARADRDISASSAMIHAALGG
eukprot:9477131-Pyramimonas_sp.AAC.1